MGTEQNLTLVGQRVRQLRDQRGWSQLKLAYQAGIALNTISRLERGELDDPKLSTLRSLAGALEIPLSELLAEPKNDGAAAGKAVGS